MIGLTDSGTYQAAVVHGCSAGGSGDIDAEPAEGEEEVG